MADPQVLKSWSGIDQAVSDRLAQGGINAVSFDVFDTLVRRRCHPELILYGVAVALDRALERSPGVASILQARHAAYGELAARNATAGHDPETNLYDLSEAWVERLSPGADSERKRELAALARERERAYELWACIPNRRLLQTCRRLRAAGHRLIYVSDMYLGDEIVAELLASCGFDDLFDAGYVSGDHAALKRTGTLFATVAAAEDLPAVALLHVGDDRLADGDMAVASGWSSIVVRDGKALRARRRQQFDLHRLRIDPAWTGVVAGEYLSVDDGEVDDAAYRFGRFLLGPQLAAMIQHLVDYVAQHGIERVYFLSREGLVLRAMYQAYVDTLAVDAPAADYLCVSRISSSYGAMGEHYGLRELSAAALANAHVSVRRLLAPLKFDEPQLERLAAACGVDDIDAPVDFHDSPSFAKLVAHPDVLEQTRAVAAEGRCALRGYLRARGFYALQRVVVVDVGWGAQIQENLALTVAGEDDAPEIHGLYLGANRYAGERRAGGLRVDSSLVDASRYDWVSGAAFDFVQLYEISTRAPHGTVLGYRDGEPVLAASGTPQRDSEDAEDGRVARAQRGMIDAARLYAQCTQITGGTVACTRPYIGALACRVNRFPRRDEVEFFLRFRNVSNFGAAETLTLGEGLPWWRPWRTYKAINRALWSEGVARLSFGVLGVILLAVLKSARIERRLPQQQDAPVASAATVENRGAAGQAPAAHAFEPAMVEHWRQLMGSRESSDDSLRPTQSLPIGWRDLALIAATQRLAALYLRLRGRRALPADLLPVGQFVRRALFERFGDRILYLRRQRRRFLAR